MKYLISFIILCVASVQPASAQNEPTNLNSVLLAQINDRCMATYAVRLSKTDVSDEEIFSRASAGCKEIEDKVFAAIRKDFAEEHAAELISKLQTQARPNFFALLERIRSDRKARARNQ